MGSLSSRRIKRQTMGSCARLRPPPVPTAIAYMPSPSPRSISTTTLEYAAFDAIQRSTSFNDLDRHTSLWLCLQALPASWFDLAPSEDRPAKKARKLGPCLSWPACMSAKRSLSYVLIAYFAARRCREARREFPKSNKDGFVQGPGVFLKD